MINDKHDSDEGGGDDMKPAGKAAPSPTSFTPSRIAFGRRLAEARHNVGQSQAGLARIVGVSQPTVATWENGSNGPSLEAVAKIAAACGVPPGWLAFGERSTDQLSPEFLYALRRIFELTTRKLSREQKVLSAAEKSQFIAGVMAIVVTNGYDKTDQTLETVFGKFGKR